MSYLKSWVWPVVAGFLCVVIFSTVTDMVLQALGIFPPQSASTQYLPWMLSLALVYRTLYTIAGGFITAWLSPADPMKRVWVLAILGQAGGIAGVIFGWNLSAHWYPIMIAVLAIPSVWFGGLLWLQMKGQTPSVQSVTY
jgi:hypothetical protein